MGAIAAGATAAAAIAVRSRVVVVEVDGISMSPTYGPGDRVLVRRCRLDHVRRGQVVVVQRPDERTGWSDPASWDGRLDGRGWYIKRAVAVPGDPVPDAVLAAVGSAGATVPPGKLVVLGDNPRSDDSKRWGYVPADRLLGVVMRRMASIGA